MSGIREYGLPFAFLGCMTIACGAQLVSAQSSPATSPANATAPAAEPPQPLQIGAMNLPAALPPLGPSQETPQPAKAATLVRMPVRPYLPPADARPVPLLLPAEMPRRLAQRPMSSPPELAQMPSDPPGRPPKLFVLPARHVAAPDPASLVGLPSQRRVNIDRPSALDDPTAANSRAMASATQPSYRQSPAPFLKLVLPDPFEVINALKLSSPPADNDPPALTPALPPKPKLSPK